MLKGFIGIEEMPKFRGMLDELLAINDRRAMGHELRGLEKIHKSINITRVEHKDYVHEYGRELLTIGEMNEICDIYSRKGNFRD